ncbi:MAG: ATP-grasp domain-containing protein [Hyphomicrobium sp.]|nr:ATP-grasp domain-containing protein [Hyphomicrobium sp.]
MTAQSVLIAAFSGRALAQSARRAGYVPLVADAFGDMDTIAAAGAVRAVDDAMNHGFRAKPLIAALDALVANTDTKPIGIVLGSGLEDKLRLVEILDRRYTLLGCSPEAMRHCKDPLVFFPVLDELGIAHPETHIAPPDDCAEWISKRIGGSGGRHIRNCTPDTRAKPRRYFQKHIDGTRISVSAIIAEDGIATTFSRQWTSPSDAQPFRYGGAVSLPESETRSAASMLTTVDKLARAFNLRGLTSFDFIVDGETAYLLEINPRPGATLDVFDDAQGSLFNAHIEAVLGQPLDRRGGDLEASRAAAILHADRGGLTLGNYDWPEWSADRGAPGTFVPAGAPLATVFADAATPDAAVARARTRLATLESLLYESPKT